MKAVCVLVSGGIDSAVLVAEAAKRYRAVHPVYVSCGLAWETAELRCLRRYLSALKNRRLRPVTLLKAPAAPLYGAHWSLTRIAVPGYLSQDGAVHLPGRNLLLLSQTAVFCAVRRVPIVLIGTLRGNPFPDSRPRFFRAFEKTVRMGLAFSLAVRAPFSALSKRDVLRRGRDLPLNLTFSCLAPHGFRACGSCNKCAERERALKSRDLDGQPNLIR